MKIYVGKNKKSSKQTTLQDLIIENLNKQGFKMDIGFFNGENHSYESNKD